MPLCVYLALLICAFVLHNPEPATFILGLTHGLLWIAMSLVCIAAARWRVIPFWLAVTVTVLGGLGRSWEHPGSSTRPGAVSGRAAPRTV